MCYVGLAACKDAYSLYLMAVYQNPNMAAAFKTAFAKAGKKLDMGKSCVRFRSLDDLPLTALGKTIAAVSVDEYLDWYQRARKKN